MQIDDSEIHFSGQAEQMLSNFPNKEEIKVKLIELAKKRVITIGGGDVIRFLSSGQLLTGIDGGQ